MILGNTKKKIIVNAGHWDDPHTAHIEDSGARSGHYIEQIECAKVRDLLVPILKARGYEVEEVPDELNLRESIAWANKKAPHLNDALAVDIHFNYLSNTSARGTETFHGTSGTSKRIAGALSEEVSKELGIPNRGAKPDTQTAVGSLGWIRKTTMWATLVEVCFLTNKDDMEAYTKNRAKAAIGIANAIDKIFGVEPKPEEEAPKCSIKDFTNLELVTELLRRFSI